MRRTAWVLLIAGPLLGAVALASQPSAPSGPATVIERGEGATGPAGFAEMYVAAYLDAGEGSEEELAVFYPDAASLDLSGPAGAVRVQRVAAVGVKDVSVQYWTVTVAVRVLQPSPQNGAQQDEGQVEASGAVKEVAQQRYFQVAVFARKAGGQDLVATTLPAEVASPTAGEGPGLEYGSVRAATGSDPAVGTLRAFFGAQLAGQGEVSRYVSPGAVLDAVRPAPYRQVRITQIAVAGRDSDVPELGDPQGAEVAQLLVQVEAQRPDGVVRPLAYAVDLRGRDGRWEVAAVGGAPLLATGTRALSETK
ncbi:conjugal transfer protein [Streptomyces odonnellii]|uniref:conjugal transfer protein n=1 Tax=Streptomyces odonnellii TaxID=1417980 RepID=UPI0012FEE955|nr:conjugal transfer protein [Streptomyces odonnellii]